MAESQASSKEQPLRRHPSFYFSKGTHVFRVEHVLYRLHDELLATHSDLFKDMFAVPCPTAESENPKEGESDMNPIFLNDESDVFDMFLGKVYGHGRTGLSYSTEELRSFIDFVEKYRCRTIREFVVEQIWEERFTFHPAELVELSVKYRLERAFKWSFKRLLDTPLKEITKEHRLSMGQSVFVALVYSKSILDEHCRLVAAEPPTILAHSDDCKDRSGCETDWRAVWWNGMGRFLLDARNPQPYHDAVKRFKRMQFGRMGVGCRTRMFDIIDQGIAFKYADTFITDVCHGLVEDMRIREDP